jgi:hypothetical protein
LSKPEIWLPGLAGKTNLRAAEQDHGDEATWWVQATAGVNYVRAELPARHLPGRTVVLDEDDLQEDDEGEVIVPRQKGEGSIWMFPGNTTRALIMVRLKQLGHKVYIEADDNYFRQPPFQRTWTWMNERDKTPQDRHSFEVHQHIARKIADGIIVATPRLAELYAPLNGNVHVCRNAVDPDDWPENPSHQEDGILRIGWAGSASHKYDLADIRLALDWASRQKDVEIRLLGHADILGSMLSMQNTKHLEFQSSLQAYRNSLQGIDVMLCPVRPGAWADAKSDLKPLEAAMSGACSIVSRVESNRPWWDGEAPGYAAKTPKDFLNVVKHLVMNRDEVEQMAQDARYYAITERNIHDTISEWRTALES